MSLPRFKLAPVLGLAAVAALPIVVQLFFAASARYYLHLLIQILLWSFIYTGWSLMGASGSPPWATGRSPASVPTRP
jgi:branched-chain amino acid transport system permease protein